MIPVQGGHSGARNAGIGVRLGGYLIRVSPAWQVTVNTRGRAAPGDREVVGQIRDAACGFLAGLAGLRLQTRVAQTVPRAGYRVTGQTRAPNGALVLQVEL